MKRSLLGILIQLMMHNVGVRVHSRHTKKMNRNQSFVVGPGNNRYSISVPLLVVLTAMDFYAIS